MLPKWEHRILSRAVLRDFWTRYKRAEQPLKAWFSEVEKANWAAPADIKRRYRSVDFLSGDRVVFNISGNNYRLIVHVKYAPLFLVFIRFVGTHTEYDEIDATKV